MNNDSYVECLVKQKQPFGWKFLRVFLIVVAVLAALVFLMFLNLVALFIAGAAGLGSYFVNLLTNLEYEYLYVDRDLSIDKVMAKSSRRKVNSYPTSRLEIMAPVHSYHLDNYRGRQCKEVDYSVGEELKPDKRYALYYEGGIKLLLNPSDELVAKMKSDAPRKVFTD